MKTKTMVLALAAFIAVSARGQSFSNLNFDLAQNLPGNPGIGALVAVTNALPDWAAYAGVSALSEIFYESNILGHAQNVELEGGSLALSGSVFSVGLYLDASISQTGAVPVNAESLEFEAHGPGPGGTLGASDLSVTLGAQTLSYSTLSDGPDYIVYGANIPSDLDGQLEALTFSVQSGGDLLDAIEFSPTSIPEPSECALIGLGTIAIGLWRRSFRFRAFQ
jgi:hypothetical protein